MLPNSQVTSHLFKSANIQGTALKLALAGLLVCGLAATPLAGATAVTVSISPTAASVQTGKTQQFTATVKGNSNTSVKWSVNKIAGGNSTVGTISAGGLYTAPNAVPSANPVSVTATSNADATKSASAAVTVAKPVAVSVLPLTASVQTGKTQQFTATVTGTANTAVKWSVNKIAGGNSTVGTVSASGLYTAPSAVPSANPVSITVTSNADATKSASATVTVTKPITISISPTSGAIVTGKTQQFTATVTGSSNTSVKWSVDAVAGGNTANGTISNAGLYTAPATVPTPSSVTVTATSVADATKSASATVTVKGTLAAKTQTITSSGGTITLSNGSSVTIPAGALTSTYSVTLTLTTGITTQPPSGFIDGVGDALVLSTATPPFKTGTGKLQFLIDSGTNTGGLSGSTGLANLVDSSGNNFFGVPDSFNANTNLSTITVPAALMNGTNNVIVSASNLAPPYGPQGDGEIGTAVPLLASQPEATGPPAPGQRSWNGSTWVPYGASCPPAGQRILVLVHGMGSSVEDAYSNNGNKVTIGNDSDYCVNQIVKAAGTNSSGDATYGQVVGFDYDWTGDIGSSSGAQFSGFLNTLAACGNPIDIEAHSEGGPVAAQGVYQADPAAQALIGNFVGLGNPWMGTPSATAASTPQGYIPITTILMSLNPILTPILGAAIVNSVSINDKSALQLTTASFLQQLQPGSQLLTQLQNSLGAKVPSMKMTLACGNNASFGDGTRVLQALALLYTTPNDGIIPVSSCQATGPGGNAMAGLDQKPTLLPVSSLSHTQLECDPNVIQAVGKSVSSPEQAAPKLVATPSSLTGFSAKQGGSNPGSQPLTISSSGAELTWNASASSSGWLSVSPDSKTTPSSITVSASIGSLAPATYTGSVSITATGASNSLHLPVSLTIDPSDWGLTVSTAGTGTGSVSESPTGGNCGVDCYSYPSGTPVKLTATASTGSTFTGWGGACGGTGTCTVTMDSNLSAVANFTKSGTNPEPGNYAGSCTAAVSSITCCADGICDSVPGTSASDSFDFTLPSGTSLSTFTSDICSKMDAAFASAGCASQSCSSTAATSTSASFSMSCTPPSVPGCSGGIVTGTCNLTLK